MNILVITAVSGFLPEFELPNIRLLQNMGYTVHYASNFENPVYHCDKTVLEKQGIICHPISIQKSPGALKKNYKALRQTKELIKTWDIQAIHCHNPMGGVIGRLAGAAGGREIYCIYTAHGFHFYEGAPKKNWICFYPAERILAEFTDEMICINQEDERRANKFSLRNHGLVSRIPGTGLDCKRFQPNSLVRQQMRAELSLSHEDFVFLSAGELNKNKNHETVIKALFSVREPHMKYFICGEGHRRKKLEQLIRKLGLQNQVFLWGYQEQIERYYQCADCFVFPSIREGMGMAALEAMSCGLPLIAADNRGSREYAGQNAILCQAKNEGEYSAAMKRVFHDNILRQSMGNNSYQMARLFSQEKTELIMRQVYERMDRALRNNETKYLLSRW